MERWAAEGVEPYSVEVDLESLKSSCTCPFSRMCKRGAAALYHAAKGGEVIDGSAVFDGLRKLSRGELFPVCGPLARYGWFQPCFEQGLIVE